MILENITAILGWTAVVNIAILMVTSISLVSMRGFITGVHSRMFGLEEKDLGRAYFQYLAQYKIAIIVLNIAPYIALRIVA